MRQGDLAFDPYSLKAVTPQDRGPRRILKSLANRNIKTPQGVCPGLP
jgi:hypothetical protein